jgi:hypothetical protein
VEVRDTESRVEAVVDPDCGLGMKEGANCSGTGAHGMSGSDGVASLGDGVHAAAGARVHESAGRTMPGRPVVSTESDEDPIRTYTSKFTTGSKVIAKA